jgi:hypothetical protein
MEPDSVESGKAAGFCGSEMVSIVLAQRLLPIRRTGRSLDFLHRRERRGTATAWRCSMTYEEYLDEVTTLMTEKYDMSDEDAIKHVMRAQAADFFTLHDDDPAMRTPERAEQDAETIFKQKNKSRPHTPAKRSAPPEK